MWYNTTPSPEGGNRAFRISKACSSCFLRLPPWRNRTSCSCWTFESLCCHHPPTCPQCVVEPLASCVNLYGFACSSGPWLRLNPVCSSICSSNLLSSPLVPMNRQLVSIYLVVVLSGSCLVGSGRVCSWRLSGRRPVPFIISMHVFTMAVASCDLHCWSWPWGVYRCRKCRTGAGPSWVLATWISPGRAVACFRLQSEVNSSHTPKFWHFTVKLQQIFTVSLPQLSFLHHKQSFKGVTIQSVHCTYQDTKLTVFNSYI